MIWWNVSIFDPETQKWLTVGYIRFDLYDCKKAKQSIRENRPRLYRKVIGFSWSLKVYVWEREKLEDLEKNFEKISKSAKLEEKTQKEVI